MKHDCVKSHSARKAEKTLKYFLFIFPTNLQIFYIVRPLFSLQSHSRLDEAESIPGCLSSVEVVQGSPHRLRGLAWRWIHPQPGPHPKAASSSTHQRCCCHFPSLGRRMKEASQPETCKRRRMIKYIGKCRIFAWNVHKDIPKAHDIIRKGIDNHENCTLPW